ncbi:3-hydroxyacyl-CoA dehydrogenase [Sphingobium sp. TA15]|uniref:3-hydroxyacyl-CoA dehydrogenase n=1 Tax=Sphingobium indicum (strain DSM 16413 / CCM 7287 / MTCC 6362 / UT26 / NBRC 101211 / UT26S) TaxID=452662 RepID=D4YXG3_SPHIU|nr:3-hydroxyacyl-CoA dehydrogenase NAD-binding domain-containing protein [Sphingobium indicum]BAI95045.1 3-hydroxyacyl-CoA dehydrogenase [Sphingobium indicum UT26S]BDD67925.1 3-hydroxyacyl-CoA dehydrogenase [Sphingobium sp. TA15]
MAFASEVASFSIREGIGECVVDAPPVNALGRDVRQALLDAVAEAAADPVVEALVIRCAGRTFFAGADIREFGKPPLPPSLPEVVAAIEESAKPVIAAIHGTALGGGLEVALGAHRRIAVSSARFGLPEVKLGLLPGAGGTQRLSRLVGVGKALAMIVGGDPISAEEALEAGLLDRKVADGTLIEAARQFAREAAGEGAPVRTRDLPVADPDRVDTVLDEYGNANPRRFGGQDAPAACVEVIRKGLHVPFDEALALERAAFTRLRDGAQSAALRHVFFAEREVSKVAGIDADTPRLPIDRVGVIGAGTMGRGIAMALLTAGLPVVLVEQRREALDAGLAGVRDLIARAVKGGRMDRASADAASARLTGSLSYDDLAEVDLVIEAAFETMEVKQVIFRALGGVAKPTAILATNTSYLDVDAIAACTSRPEQVLGLHFFSPANIMKLLEIVRGARTSPQVLATALDLAKRLGKIAVVAGNAHGFIGNRMLMARRLAAEAMALEGASPYAIDRVLVAFGMPMGPFRIGDLAGLDLGWTPETSTGSTIRERLNERGRRGQKVGAGFYDYDDEGRATPSPEVERIIAELAADKAIPQRDWSDEAILAGLLDPMIEEGRRIVAEGIAQRASDVDMVWVHGYGWPRWRGGPLYYADHRGEAG